MPVVRAWAPRLVLVAFPLFVVAVLAALVWLSFAASAATHLSIQPFLRWIVVPLVVVVAAAIWRTVRSGRAEPLDGPELTAQDHPALWAEVTQLARAAQTDPPARIVLTRESNASVTEAAGIKEMELGIPILGALTVTELRAVLGHELGHFVGGDTSEPAFLARTRQALHRIWSEAPWYSRWLFRAYLTLYSWASAGPDRAAETLADEVMVRVAGRDATVAALQGLVRAEHADFLVSVERMPACEPSRLRGPVAGAIADVVAARVLSDEDLAEALAEQEASAFDTHPPLRERIARVRSLPDVAVPRDDRSALVLVGGAERLAEHEGELRVAHEALATWDEVLAAGGAVAARQVGDQLVVELAENEVCHPASYRAALEAAARDIEEDGELWGSYSTLNHLVDGALARVPGARQVVRDARVVWTASDGGIIAPPEPADEASGAERVTGLIGWLASWGAPLDEPVTASRQAWELPELIEWRSHQRTAEGDTVHVAAWTSGVLLLPAEYSAGTRAAANVGVTPDRSLLERAVGESPFDARLLPGAAWIPAEQVASVKEAILRGRLTLTLSDGTTHELTAQPGSGEKIIAHGGLVELPDWVAANGLAATS